MREIEQLAARAAEAAQEISFGVQQQEAGAGQVADGTRDVAAVAQQLADSSSQNREAAASLAGLTDRVLTVVRRFKLR